MRRPHSPEIVGIALIALALAGCGEDPGVQQGTVHFEGTRTEPLDPLKNEMQKKMQDRSYMKKSGEDGKPAAETKPAGEMKPAGETKPAADVAARLLTEWFRSDWPAFRLMAPDLSVAESLTHANSNGREQVAVAAGAELDQRDPRRGVRHEDVQQPVAAARRGPGELGALAGDVLHGLAAAGVHLNHLAVHIFRIIGAHGKRRYADVGRPVSLRWTGVATKAEERG